MCLSEKRPQVFNHWSGVMMMARTHCTLNRLTVQSFLIYGRLNFGELQYLGLLIFPGMLYFLLITTLN